jgi:sugar lactone lactonase YvrE
VSSAGTRVLVDGFGYLESPRWRDGELWFSDFFSRRVHSVDPAGRVTVQGYVPGQPSGIGFLPDGSALVASTYSRELVRLVDGRVDVVATTGAAFAGPLNDMAVHPTGRAYVSPLAGRRTSGERRRGGGDPLLLVDGATVRVAEVGLAGPNGLVLADGGATLIVAETNAHRLTAFDVAADGDLGRRRLFADLGELSPDGLCLDAEGAVWVGCVFDERFVRVAEGGEILDVVPVPGRWAVAPALGGAAGTVLYCTTARTSLAQFRRGVGTAAIEMCEVSVPGTV